MDTTGTDEIATAMWRGAEGRKSLVGCSGHSDIHNAVATIPVGYLGYRAPGLGCSKTNRL